MSKCKTTLKPFCFFIFRTSGKKQEVLRQKGDSLNNVTMIKNFSDNIIYITFLVLKMNVSRKLFCHDFCTYFEIFQQNNEFKKWKRY